MKCVCEFVFTCWSSSALVRQIQFSLSIALFNQSHSLITLTCSPNAYITWRIASAFSNLKYLSKNYYTTATISDWPCGILEGHLMACLPCGFQHIQILLNFSLRIAHVAELSKSESSFQVHLISEKWRFSLIADNDND